MAELLGFIIDEFWLLEKAIEVLIFSVLIFASLKILPKLPIWFDEYIDRIVKIDFSDKSKEEMGTIIKLIIYLAAIYGFFVIFEVQAITSNKAFQLIALYFVSRIVMSILRPSIKKIDSKMESFELSEHGHKMIENMISYAVYAVAFIISMSILGYTEVFTAALASAGIVGITVGFAAKDVVSNTLAGVSIAFDKPLKFGEVIEINGNIGIVEDIGLRMLKLKTFDNKVIMVPNSLITSGAVINHTRKTTRRIDIPIGIAYESDLHKAMEIMLEVPKKVKGVITENNKKPTQVFINNFGNSSIDLILRFWLDIKKGSLVQAQSETRELIFKEFLKKNIEIPYPRQVFISKDFSIKTKK